jgi:hypothetical protein
MWTPELLSTQMEESYKRLSDRMSALAHVESLLFDAQAKLTRVREWHRLNDDSATLGKNEAQRSAALADKCAAEAKIVSDMEKGRIEVRTDVERIRLGIEHLRAQLRILELSAGIRAAA